MRSGRQRVWLCAVRRPSGRLVVARESRWLLGAGGRCLLSGGRVLDLEGGGLVVLLCIFIFELSCRDRDESSKLPKSESGLPAQSDVTFQVLQQVRTDTP
jgi:hypothetical protein